MSAWTNLDSEQKNVVASLIVYGQRERRPPVFILSAVFTGIREQNLRNQPSGSGTSLGWRQEIEGKGSARQRMTLSYSIPHYYRECAEIYRPGMAANLLAERVQRPLNPYPEQAQSLAQAQAIIASAPAAGLDLLRYTHSASLSPIGSHRNPAEAAVMHVSTGGDPPDRSHKIYLTGQHAGSKGSQFGGHTIAMRNLRNRHNPIHLR